MARRKTLDEFINDSINIHGGKYDYTLVDYKKNSIKVKIICPTHGIFEQTPCIHLRGHGCIKCVKYKNNKTTEEFIIDSRNVHGDKYDYSLVEYTKSSKKVKIICHIHGVFEQESNSHLKGYGCPKCSGKNNKTTEEFIESVKSIHENDKYDYSLVRYENNYTKIKIICPIHGIFEQRPTDHLNGNGCPKCIGRNKTTEEFIEEVNNIHENDKYDYSLVEYVNNHTKVKIICPVHGIFEQTPNNHLQGCGCPMCKTSKGEKTISGILSSNQMEFEQEKRFEDCKNINTLPFDFYLPEHNLCIEYDGKQHFEIVEYWGGEKGLIKRQHNDKIKNKYCHDNNIKLLRISYNDDIEAMLSEYI